MTVIYCPLSGLIVPSGQSNLETEYSINLTIISSTGKVRDRQVEISAQIDQAHTTNSADCADCKII